MVEATLYLASAQPYPYVKLAAATLRLNLQRITVQFLWQRLESKTNLSI
jgi:hypothetical protein